MTVLSRSAASLRVFGDIVVTIWVVASTATFPLNLLDGSSLWFTYFLALGPTIFMLPILLALKRDGLVSWPSALGDGAAAGTILGWIWLRGFSTALALCSVAGAGETLVFWLMWRYLAREELVA